MRLGFLGTGTITAAMVRGLKGSRLADLPVILSPRNAGLAASLARDWPGVSVAASNQEVVDRAEILVLAVRPQIAEEVLRALTFRANQRVISLIAGLDHESLTAWTGLTDPCRAVPLPFVAERRDATPVFPPLPFALDLFDALGRALPVADRGEFDTYAALSALMGSYFGIVETACRWGEAQGLPEEAARAYLGQLFANLGQVLQSSPGSLAQLRTDHSTAGGLNEQVFRVFAQSGGPEAIDLALTSVLRRIRGQA